jgi:thymidine kinase
MSKLYFRYGTVGSAKTLNLLAVRHNYIQQNKSCWLIKPAIDTRYGQDIVKTRAGLEAQADIVIYPENSPRFLELFLSTGKSPDCILVDEAQFLEVSHINIFRKVVDNTNTPIICYGLRTDFRCNSFPASQRLLELADSIEEIKTTCHYCIKKAVFNLKTINGQPTLSGDSIQLGWEETYLPVCSKCYSKLTT